jgi:hypothetical protein
MRRLAADRVGWSRRRVGVSALAAERRDLRQSEVEHLRGSSLGDENVGGLDVAMRNALRVRGFECFGDLDSESEQVVGTRRPLGDALLERHAVEVLHDNAGAAVLLADVVDGADVRVVQGGRGTRLPFEPPEGVRVARDGFWQKLERHESAQASVFGLVHHAHPAAARLLDDAVVRDGLTGQRSRSF